MRVSQYFHLGVDQGGLDFVDVDVVDDIPVFIDPKAIRLQTGTWAEECQDLLVSYFAELLDAISRSDTARIYELIRSLGSEPNETHLGLSDGESHGRGLGPTQRQRLVDALARSRAATTGLLQDLEDAALFVPGIDKDFVSDMTTSIIRGPLVRYTQQMAAFHGIPTTKQWTGLMWDSDKLEWINSEEPMPRGPSGKLLLVPRSIVRAQLSTNAGKYYRDYLRPYLIEDEIRASTALVHTLRTGRKRVYKKEVDAKYGTDKEAIERNTENHPEALEEFRASITPATFPPLDHEAFTETVGSPTVDYDALMEEVEAIAPGRGGATSYHRAVAALLTALFDSSLGNADIEVPIHDGRKRIDIRYDNTAPVGFFRWLGLHRSASTVVVECKNYSGDPGNPELDQLIGRFSNDRGRIGFLVCRTFEDKALFEQRCRDTAKDGNGFIIALDDDDLRELVGWAKSVQGKTLTERAAFPLLRERFGRLID